MNPHWQNFRQATCLPDWCFCEAIHAEGWLSQPANSVSAWVMFAFGVAILIHLALQPKPEPHLERIPLMRISSWMGIIYAFALCILGLGTFAYHATLTFAGQWADIIGMYFIASYLILYLVAQNKSWSVKKFALTYAGTNLALACFGYNFPDLRRWLFAVLVVYGVIQIIRARKEQKWLYENKWLGMALAALGTATVIWILDIRKIVCAPDNILQGHALWHVLTSFAAYCGYRYFNSGKTKASNT